VSADPLATLFPRPRSTQRRSGTVAPNTSAAERADASLPPQGYELTVDHRDGVELRHADDAGRRYGRQTLHQLRGAKGGIPCCRISDAPDLEIRGFLLDISRDRVPTRETLELLVERLENLRFNHLQLYMEHTFAYRDHETVWRDASPLTPDDVRWLDDRCDRSGIELAACQNTFGHMERWLAHDQYRARAEAPDGWQRGPHRHAPTALAPTPENATFALALVRELAANFRSRRVNIGCDEVWELGLGASADEVARRGKETVFVEHLRRIAEPLLAEGFEVQFWADMVQRAPDAARPLAAANALAAVWGYEAPMEVDPATFDFEALPEELREPAREYFETSARGFGPRLTDFSATGFRTWVVPGTSGWNSFVGRYANARANILDAVTSGLDHGVDRFLLTEWGDHGHFQPPFVALPLIAYGGATAWCAGSNGDLADAALAAAVDRLLVDPTRNIGSGLLALGRVDDHVPGRVNGTTFFDAVMVSDADVALGTSTRDGYRAALATIDAAERHLAASDPATRDGPELLRELHHAAALARHGLHWLARDHGLAAPSADVLEAERADLLREQRACWLARSRPGGLEDSLRKLRR